MSMTSAPSPMSREVLPLRFDNTLGAFLVGGLLGMAMWGITSVQAYNYFAHIKNRDRPPLRVMVAILWLMDTTDSALSGHTLYYYLVTHYGDLITLLKPTWSIIARIALTSTTNFAIRTLFALRVYRLSRGNLYLTGWIMLISTAQLGIGILVTIKTHAMYFSELSEIRSTLYALFCLATASDLSVTAILIWLLRGSKTGYAKTDSVIRILMAYTINTGFVVAVDATAAMVSYITMPHNFIALAFYFIISKLYLNSYLATMNAREMLRYRAEASFRSGGVSTAGRREVEASPDHPAGSYVNLKPLNTSLGHTSFLPQVVDVSLSPYDGQQKVSHWNS